MFPLRYISEFHDGPASDMAEGPAGASPITKKKANQGAAETQSSPLGCVSVVIDRFTRKTSTSTATKDNGTTLTKPVLILVAPSVYP